MDAWEGYATAKGLKKKTKNVLSKDDVSQLRKELEAAKLKEKQKHDER